MKKATEQMMLPEGTSYAGYYQGRVTEIMDAATVGTMVYPDHFEADCDSCLLRRMSPEQAAEKLLAEYQVAVE